MRKCKINLMMFFFIVLGLSSTAQEVLEKNYSVSLGYSLIGISAAQTDNGDFLIICRGDSLMDNSQAYIEPLFLFKVNQIGDTIWTKQYSIANLETPTKIRKTNDNNFIILAESYSSEIILIKIAPDGILLWEERYNAPYNSNFWLNDMIVSATGDYLVTGWDLDNSYVMRPFVLRTDSNGNQLWYRTDYTSGLIDISSTSLAEDNDGNIYLAGRLDPQPGGGSWDHNICITKINSVGDIIWQMNYDGLSNSGDPDYAYAIIVSSDNHLIVTGESYVTGNGYITNFFKLDLDGNLITKNQYYNGEIWGQSIAECPNGDFYISGKGFDASVSNSYINSILKVDNEGQLIWSQFYCNYTAINSYTIVNGISREIFALSDDKWFSIGDIVFDEAILIGVEYYEPRSLYVITPDIFVSTGQKYEELNIIDAFPNPATDVLHVSFKSNSVTRIRLIDINGVVLEEIPLAHNIYKLTLNLEKYNAGNYFLQAVTEEGSQTIKLIIQ